MDCKNRMIKLRESTGLNRKDFCKLVHIPYRTMTEWELVETHWFPLTDNPLVQSSHVVGLCSAVS